MIPRLFPVLLGVFLILSASPARAESRPNILFFLSDDHRWDRLGCAGHPYLQTPVIDDLARKGVRFENMFVTTSICAASRATLFTGLYERTHGYTFGTPSVSGPHTLFSYPAVLRRSGYRTGFVGKFGVGIEGNKPESRWFDFYRPLNRNPYHKPRPDGSTRHVTEIAGDEAIAFLRLQDRKTPFCLSVSFNAAHAEDSDKVPGKGHYPWPKAVDGLYEDIPVGPPALNDASIFEAHPPFLRESMNRDRFFWRWDTPEKYATNLRAYYRMITGLDRVMGRVIRELKTLGLDQNTVIVFSGDNGYYEAQRGFAGKWSHYEESLRVPLVIYDPRLPAAKRGQVRSEMVLNMDLAPTFADLAGVDAPSHYQGSSLVPLLRNEPAGTWRSDFFCEHLMDHPDIPKWEGVRAQQYVYARYFQQTPAYEYLHDLRADPQQLVNLVSNPEYAPVLKEMRKRSDQLRDEAGGPFDAERIRYHKQKRQRSQRPKPAPRKLSALTPVKGMVPSWPEFRGPTGQGHTAENTELPLTWSASENVAWKTPIPGKGWSSPVVAEGSIFLTSAVSQTEDQDAPADTARSLRALAIDPDSGAVQWSTEVFVQRGDARQRIHKKNSHASPTPLVRDGKLFVHFGHQGTACLDTKGKILWQNRDLSYRPVHGNGGSPILVGDNLILSCDGASNPFAAALSARSGRVVWKTPRNTKAKKTFSFSTPLLVEAGNRQEVILPGSGNLFAYDPRNGRELWRCNWGEGYSVVPRPVFGHGLVFASSGYDRPVLYAVRPGGSGDVTETHLAWKHEAKGVPRNSSFLLSGRELFTFDDKGIGTCFDAESGEVHWQERVLSDTSSSPLLADGKIYIIDESGTCVILEASKTFRVLAENDLGERTLASMTPLGNRLLIRTEENLYCIEP